MRSQDLSRLITDDAGSDGSRMSLSEESPVISFRKETKLLTIWLGRRAKAFLRGQCPHVTLTHGAERKTNSSKLRLGEAVEEIALILVRIDSAL